MIPNAGNVDTQIDLLRILIACIPPVARKKDRSFFLASMGTLDGFEKIDKYAEFENQARSYLYARRISVANALDLTKMLELTFKHPPFHSLGRFLVLTSPKQVLAHTLMNGPLKRVFGWT